MFLHRYFGSHAFETLRNAELKTSRISSFNDSFEFLFVSTGEMTTGEAIRFIDAQLCNPVRVFDLIQANENSINPKSAPELKRLIDERTPALAKDLVERWPDIVKETELTVERRRQIIDEELRAICFSRAGDVARTDEILLWSHYANKHWGVRIGFEFPEAEAGAFQIIPITYQPQRATVVWSPERTQDTLMAMERSASVKCDVWRYEQESRLFTKTSLCGSPRELKKCGSNGEKEYFLSFSREWVRCVDFGVFCRDNEIQRIVNLLKGSYPNAIARRAEFHKSDFAFEYRQILP